MAARRASAAGILLLWLLAALAPEATAAMRLTATPASAAPVVAGADLVDVTVDGDVDCASLLPRLPPAGTVVQAQVAFSGALLVSGPSALLLDAATCGAGGATAVPFSFPLRAMLRADAPALLPQPADVTVTLAGEPVEAEEARATFTLRGQPFLLLSIESAGTFQQGARGWAQYPVTLRNAGNAAALVTARLETAVDGAPATLEADVTPLHLEPGEAGTALVSVRLPEGPYMEARAVARFTATAVAAPEVASQPASADLLALPAPDNRTPGAPLAALVASIGLAVAVRARHGT